MRNLLLLSVFLIGLSMFAQQEIKVVSYKLNTTDISVRTNRRDDPTGKPCALIKVQFPKRNVQFLGDIIGNVAFKTNEYWVYMPQSSNQLEVRLDGYNPLYVKFSEFETGTLESNQSTYELCLLAKEKNASELYEDGMIALAKNDIVIGFENLTKAADAGYNRAWYVLGKENIIPFDSRWEKDPNEPEAYQIALDYYKKAADKELPEAQCALGKMLLDYKKAKSYDRGDNISKAIIDGKMLEDTYIWNLVEKSANAGVADAQWMMCKDMKWCEDNAKKGVPIAEFAMGLRCDTIFGCDTDDYPMAEGIILNIDKQRVINYREALKWYNKAAEKGLDAAQWKLGYMYALGLGVEKDLEKSMYWRKKAAEQGYVVYQLEMAMSYNYGVISDLSTYLSWGTAENGMPAWDAKIPRNADDADYWLRKVSNHELSKGEIWIIDGNDMYSSAMYMLAEKFEKRGDYRKAIYWYQRTGEKDGDASDKGYALGELGRIFMEGLGVEKDYSNAKRYLEQGVDAKSSKSACYLGILYRDGLGVEKDFETAKSYFLKSIDYCNWEAQPYYELGNLYFDSSKYDDALKYYDLASSRGDEESGGPLTERVYVKLDGYSSLAIYKRGLIYLKGLGGEIDKEKGIEYFRRAASRGCENAINELKEMNLPVPSLIIEKKQTEIKRDILKWYKEAAEQGSIESQFQLGCIYANGKISVDDEYSRIVEIDDTEALKWYAKAAEQGNKKAQYNLAWKNQYGKGIPVNYTEALKWYTLAANQGFREAQHQIGIMYYKGLGVEKSDVEAVKWFTKAAEQGLINAQYMLGQCYEYGVGVTMSSEQALKWYSLAAKQGDRQAIEKINSIKAKMN